MRNKPLSQSYCLIRNINNWFIQVSESTFIGKLVQRFMAVIRSWLKNQRDKFFYPTLILITVPWNWKPVCYQWATMTLSILNEYKFAYIEWIVVLYIQRKVHSRNKSTDEKMKAYGIQINIIFKTIFKNPVNFLERFSQMVSRS